MEIFFAYRKYKSNLYDYIKMKINFVRIPVIGAEVYFKHGRVRIIGIVEKHFYDYQAETITVFIQQL